ncbi:MAG TPA: SUMF1/EgtB/PvdO family nonheme iron enzyme [Planctomycetota bacterium]|nr:SUMF1/EgtB/PvdO family nonheme iron enzyme [Planctomycetota bacterium]
MRCVAVLLLAVVAHADGLTYLGLNEQGAEEWYREIDGAVVIRVPGGDFLRRPYEGKIAVEEPKPFPVKSFFIDKHEVTNEQFARFLSQLADAADLVDPQVPGLVRDGSAWRAVPGHERYPVTAATGKGVLAYAKWVKGRIPEAAEWEKAAGGVDGKLYPWGDEKPTAAYANFGLPHPRGLEPVGSHVAGASPFGCLDMAGNAYDRVLTRGLPVMLKGGSWLSPHPLNLRVLDLCMQPMEVADGSVGFRCAVDDPEPDREPRKPEVKATLRLAKSWDLAVKEARERRVPIFLSLQHDTCGQCDRMRAQLFTDPRFVAFCNERLVVAFGMDPKDAEFDPHPENEDGSCPLMPGIDCIDHMEIYRDGLFVVRVFRVSPGNFLLDPFACENDAGEKAILVGEADLPKSGVGVDAYLAAFARAEAALAAAHPKGKE